MAVPARRNPGSHHRVPGSRSPPQVAAEEVAATVAAVGAAHVPASHPVGQVPFCRHPSGVLVAAVLHHERVRCSATDQMAVYHHPSGVLVVAAPSEELVVAAVRHPATTGVAVSARVDACRRRLARVDACRPIRRATGVYDEPKVAACRPNLHRRPSLRRRLARVV